MFKKLLCVIFAAAICFTCASPVFADNGGYFTPFTVTVEAPSGTVLYDRVWSSDMTRSIMRPMSVYVPNGASMTVTGEREFEGEVYLAVEYQDINAYVQRSKVSLMRDFVGDDLAFPTSAERKLAVINPDGVSLQKGPSLAYGKVIEKNIPYGTVLEYSKTNCKSEDDAQWAYTEYKGKTGWVYIYQMESENIYDCASVLDGDSIYTGTVDVLTAAYLTESPRSGSAKVVEGIPAGTVMAFKYYYEKIDYSVSVFVEYNGIKGWLHTMSSDYKVAVGEKGGLYVLAENGLAMYEKPLDASAQAIATLPKNTNLCVKELVWVTDLTENGITVDRWLNVEYNGTDGWVYCSNISDYCYMSSAFDLKVNAENGLSIYAEQNENSQILGTIPKDTSATCAYEKESVKGEEAAYWSYISYDGLNGWIFATDAEASVVEGSKKILDAPFGAEEITRSLAENAPELKDGLPAFAIIIICAAAAAIAATVVVIIIVKKKKSK